jgi:hypothetical protein
MTRPGSTALPRVCERRLGFAIPKRTRHAGEANILALEGDHHLVNGRLMAA